MRNDDSFRLLDPDEAVGIVCLLIAVAAFALLTVDEKPALPQPVSRAPVCAVTVAQYGPGERWHPQLPQPTCIPTIRGELANHLLTMPVQEKQ